MADSFGFTNTGAQSGMQQEVSVSLATDVDITSDATRDLGKVILSEYTPIGNRLPVFGPLTDVELRANAVPTIANAGYRLSDIEESSTSYFGFLTSAGAWYIMQVTSTTIRYFKGASDYTTNWTGRAALAYDYYDTIF